MADHDETSELDDEPGAHTGGDPVDEAAASVDDTTSGRAGSEARTGAATSEPAASEDRWLPESQVLANMSTIGKLTVHFPRRDVSWILEGDAALRIMAMMAGDNDQHLGDVLKVTSSARNGWFVIDRAKAVAVSWIPNGSELGADRITVDPIFS